MTNIENLIHMLMSNNVNFTQIGSKVLIYKDHGVIFFYFADDGNKLVEHGFFIKPPAELP
jgi:hypothetical protein